MVSVEPSKVNHPLVSMAKNVVLQPVLFVQSLPYVVAQLSAYGMDFLRRPVMWIALGTHGLFLLLPAVDLTASKLEQLIEPAPEEAPVIEVQNLADLIRAAPEAAALPPPLEEVPPPEMSVAAAPPEEMMLPDVDDIPEDLPLEEPSLEEPSLEEPVDTPQFDRSVAQGQASDRTRMLGETTPPAPLLLEESQRPLFFDMEAGNKLEAPLVVGLKDLIVFNDATLAEKEQEILDSFISGGDNPVLISEYGNLPLYQLINVAANEGIGYLSIFQGDGGRTVFVGLWETLPP